MNDPENPSPKPHSAASADPTDNNAEGETRREKTPAQKAAAARKRARRMAKLRPASEVADVLYARFPNALFRDSRSRQPLEVGVHLKLLEAIGEDLHKLEIQRFMNNYAHSLGYLHAIAARRPRIDLDGNVVDEEITDDMVSDARTEIDEIQQKRAARGEKPKRGPAAAKSGRGAGGAAKPRGGGYLGLGRKPAGGARRPVEGSAEELREDANRRNFRTAKIIEKKPRRAPVADVKTLLGQKLADAGLNPSGPRKKLKLGRKSQTDRETPDAD